MITQNIRGYEIEICSRSIVVKLGQHTLLTVKIKKIPQQIIVNSSHELILKHSEKNIDKYQIVS